MKTSFLLFLYLLLAVPFTGGCDAQRRDDPVVAELRKQLYDKELNIRPLLHYPQSVMRFYRLNDQTPVWLSSSGQNTAGQAMLLLDCVLAYGLSPKDYHAKELSYNTLEALSEKQDTLSLATKIRFEIMLTDAVITLANNLHFGKLNPDYSQSRIDAAMNMPFHADDILAAALKVKQFKEAILNVQPNSKEYSDLQYWMRLWKGRYTGDCYEVPDSDVRHVAINMERLRWASINDSAAYIQVNIPSYTLKYHLPDTDRLFKVIVGKPATPTPTLQSEIAYFTTAPDWTVPHKILVNEILPKALSNPAYLDQNKFGIYDRNGLVDRPDKFTLQQIQKSPLGYYAKQSSGCDNALGSLVFRFKNLFDVYLHDTPEQQLFGNDRRAFSHGCIRVQNAAQLAELLLTNDGSTKRIPQLKKDLAKEKKENFILNRPVPVKVTYLTCEMKEGYLVNYRDIYSLDAALIASFYDDVRLLTMK